MDTILKQKLGRFMEDKDVEMLAKWVSPTIAYSRLYRYPSGEENSNVFGVLRKAISSLTNKLELHLDTSYDTLVLS